MRVAVQDNWLNRFSGVLQEHWKKQGHTVLWEPGFNPNLIETCDRVFFESADTNAHLASQRRPHKKGKVFVRIVDIDAHVNGPAGIRPGYFDGIIYIAEHIQKLCQERFPQHNDTPSKIISMGVDTKKFSYREKQGKKIAFISTRLTPEKGFDRALMIFKDLLKHSNQYELHVVGRMYENSVWQMHIDHLLDGMKNKVKFYDNLPYTTGNEVNDFLEDKDILLSCSHKEAFSFVTAEAMSKGLKPVVYNFYGADKIWPPDILFNTPSEAVELIVRGEYSPKRYREWIERNYPLDKHLKEMDKFMGI